MSYLDLDLMIRYAGRACSTEERKRFECWLSEDERNRELYDAVLAVRAGTASAPGDTARAERQFLLARDGRGPPGTARLAVRSPVWLTRAAAAALLATATLTAWRAVDRWLAPPHSATLRAVATRPGRRLSFDLAGMHIVLGGASTLRYSTAADGERTEMWLDGQAFFDVPRGARPRQLLVHATHASAEDLGASFVMQAYAADGDAQVVVTSTDTGEVVLRADRGAGREVVLRGELGRANGDGAMSLRHVDPDPYFAWTHGRLEFRHATLGGVLTEMERWYDVAFQVADSSLLARDVTADFDGDSLPAAVDELAATAGLHVEQRGRTIVVRAREARATNHL